MTSKEKLGETATNRRRQSSGVESIKGISPMYQDRLITRSHISVSSYLNSREKIITKEKEIKKQKKTDKSYKELRGTNLIFV